MAEFTAPGSGEAATRAIEEAAFYHEAALNANWTASRLAIGSLSFLFGAFAFAYFYLFSSNGHGKWLPSSTTPPQAGYGVAIMVLIVVSALLQTVGLQRIKAGYKGPWFISAVIALVLGLAAVALQLVELLNLPFQPGQSGFASVFVGFYPVALVIWLAAMVWLETLVVRSRQIPAISFVEQPPTYAQAYEVQRFQAALSGFTVVWNYLAVVAFIFWLLFYVRLAGGMTTVSTLAAMHLAEGPAMYFGGTMETFALPLGAFIVITLVLFYLFRLEHSGPKLKYLRTAPVSSVLTREPGPVPAPPVTPEEADTTAAEAEAEAVVVEEVALAPDEATAVPETTRLPEAGAGPGATPDTEATAGPESAEGKDTE